MTPLQIKQVASEIAARIPAMAQDCATNNAVVIENLLHEAFKIDRYVMLPKARGSKDKTAVNLDCFGGDSCKISLPNRIP